MIVLASGSPRRKDILGQFAEDFKVIVPNVDESRIRLNFDFFKEQDRLQVTQNLSYEKCKTIVEKTELAKEDVVLAADTIVFFDGRDYEKPLDRQEALRMLRELAGNTHDVVTGVSIYKNGKIESFAIKTEVKFIDYSDEYEKFAEEYVEEGLSDGKAGAYGIQDKGAFFVDEIKGDFFNVVGLPMEAIRRIFHFNRG